ncbi:MAG: RNA-binding protein, partial [Stellaceae bacterium]
MWVRNNKGNVFVGNLPPDFSDERLAEAFDPFGIVLTAAIARDPSTGARLRYGFVDIATEKAASQAIAALDGSEIDGCKLNVKPREAAKKAPGGRTRRPPPRAAAPNGMS